MPFYGIDPEGLIDLAGAVLNAGGQVRRSTQPALAVLDRHRQTAAVAGLASFRSRISLWSNDVANTLRWRAQVIGEGQNSLFDVSALLAARFATEAVFTTSTLDAAYRQWIDDRVASEQEIADSIAAISRWLSQSITDWDVSNNDLHNIRRTLGSLTGPSLDRVLEALTPARLERWIAEMGHSFNGFSKEEKQDVFELLASHASGPSLGKVHDAILEAAGTDELADFGDAILDHGTDQAVVEFIRYVAAQGLESHRFAALAPAIAMTGLDESDTATAATSIVVNSENALGAMALDSLLHDSSGVLFNDWSSVLDRTSNDTDRATAFIAFASIATSPHGLLGQLIKERNRPSTIDNKARQHENARMAEDAQRSFLTAATHLIEADPTATINHLARSLDVEGVLTSAYWKLMVEDGRAASIGSILRVLRGGDEIDIEAFSVVGLDPDYRYPHARSLAFAAATLNRGFINAADAAEGDIDTIVRVAGVATAAAGLITKGADLVTALVGAGADLGIAAHGEDVKDNIDAQLASVIDTMCGQLRPTDDGLADPPVGLSGALTAWLNSYTALLERA